MSYLANYKGAPMLKLVAVLVLTLFLWIPLLMIQSLVTERQNRGKTASQEVGQNWGQEQVIEGPILIVPYRAWVTKERYEKRNAIFLPKSFKIDGAIESEVRRRGIFNIPLYDANLSLVGEFDRPDFSTLNIEYSPNDILWQEASLSFGISDPHGLKDKIEFSWNGNESKWKPEGVKTPFTNSISTRLDSVGPGTNKFAIKLKLLGNTSFQFASWAQETEAKLSAPWPSPQFIGSLPLDRVVTDKGFQATWKRIDSSASQPRQWVDEGHFRTFYPVQSGVTLVFGVNHYQQTERAIKYGILFIILTFTVFFLFETLAGLSIHFVQYLLAGFSLCLFYALLLSISEHATFGLAYLVATTATVGSVALYAWSFLRLRSRAIILGTLLSGLYTYLYVLLGLEDYALLMGSLGLFVSLCCVMYLTRSINWYGNASKTEIL